MPSPLNAPYPDFGSAGEIPPGDYVLALILWPMLNILASRAIGRDPQHYLNVCNETIHDTLCSFADSARQAQIHAIYNDITGLD